MKKIISLFQRNYDGDRLVRDEIVPGAEWVVAGEGVATQKLDGTCCLIEDRKLFKRYDVKKGRSIPPGFIPAQDADEVTGHLPGWLPARRDDPADKWHFEAFDHLVQVLGPTPPDGTYELCGPKVQGNPEHFSLHVLCPHGKIVFSDAPRTFTAIRDWFRGQDIEGIVWHHPDGRMVKIKKKDFGLKRGD